MARRWIADETMDKPLSKILNDLMMWELERPYVEQLFELVQDNQHYFGALPGDRKLECVVKRLKADIDNTCTNTVHCEE